MDFTEQIVNALLANWPLVVGLIIIGTWIVKTFYPQLLKKPVSHQYTAAPPTQLVVQLDPEVSRVIHETAQAIKGVSEIVERRDDSGVPLVYSDRRQEGAVVKIADVLKDLSETQRRLAESMARLDSRFETHDKTDTLTWARISDTLIRIEAIAANNKDVLLSIVKDLQQVSKALDDIYREISQQDQRMTKVFSAEK